MRRALLAVLVLLPAAAFAAFPDRPLRVVVGFPPGGAGDFTARIIAAMAEAVLGQNAVVENRTGANGAIAAEFVARNGRDGYTVFQCPMGAMAISPYLPGQRLPVDVVTEMIPIANLALSNYALVVAANSRFRSLAEILAAAKAEPGKLTFASAGIGSAQHIGGEMLKRMAGVEIVHVPFRGGAPAIVDIIGGRVDFMITNLGDVAGQLRDGSMRLLAVADDQGHPGFPTEPISKTVPGYSLTGWFGVCGAVGMPAEAVAAWARALEQGLAREDFRKRLLDQGLMPHFEGPQALSARLEQNRAQFRELIQAAGIRAE